MKNIIPILLVCLINLFNQPVYAAVPATVSYQGYLTDPSGNALDGPVSITFSLYNTPVAGAADWAETQLVTVSKGLFQVQLGASSAFPVGLFDIPVFLGIRVATDLEMLPRQALNSVGYALKAEDADTLAGFIPADLNQSAHLTNFGNPHNVTAAQVGAVTPANLASHASNASAHHTKYTNTEAKLAMGAKSNANPLNHDKTTSLHWNNITGKPAGFADNIDNNSGGDITSVTAGTGLNGGSGSGNATLNVDVPLILTGNSLTNGTVFATNNNGGYGSFAIKGANTIGSPTQGYLGVEGNTNFDGILALDNPSFEIGVLGVSAGTAIPSDNYGLYGFSNGTGLFAEGSVLAAKFVGDIDVSGNVGIGTAPSSNKLDIRGGQSGYLINVLNDNNGSGSTYALVAKGDAYGTGSGTGRGGYFEGKGGSSGGSAYGSMGYAYAYGSSNAYGVYSYATGGTTTGKEYAFYGIGKSYFSDNVGIGTNNPSSRLHVAGDSYFTGKVGIGVQNPATRLHLNFDSDASYNNGSGVLLIGAESGYNLVIDNNEIIARNNGVPSKLYLNKDGTHTVVTGLEITGGADIAEPFKVSDQYKVLPGMVMAIDADNPGKLRIADNSYDRTVAGIVSGAKGINPGLHLTQTGVDVTEGTTPIALTGRLYALADASYGEIKPGDLLTTSDTLGHVMRVSDYSKAHGAIIGKAMTSLDKGKGHVLVLVSLQ